MKIVINDRHGGFGLSKEAMQRYAELKGITLYSNDEKISNAIEFTTYFTVPLEERNPILLRDRYSLSANDKNLFNKVYNDSTLNPDNIPRDDPILVKVVEELGESANGHYASLKVVEIPDCVKWHIEEYDGAEHIAEDHRTWS